MMQGVCPISLACLGLEVALGALLEVGDRRGGACVGAVAGEVLTELVGGVDDYWQVLLVDAQITLSTVPAAAPGTRFNSIFAECRSAARALSCSRSSHAMRGYLPVAAVFRYAP